MLVLKHSHWTAITTHMHEVYLQITYIQFWNAYSSKQTLVMGSVGSSITVEEDWQNMQQDKYELCSCG